MTYTNSVACTPDLATPERFRCGTASFLRFAIDYDENGTISSLAATRGTTVDSVSASLVTWTPASTAGTAGIIGPDGETATLSFAYTLGGSVGNGTTISFPTRSYWSKGSSPGDPTAAAQTALTCSASVTATVPPLTHLKSGVFNDESTDGVAQPGDAPRPWRTAGARHSHAVGGGQAPRRPRPRRARARQPAAATRSVGCGVALLDDTAGASTPPATLPRFPPFRGLGRSPRRARIRAACVMP